LFDILLLFCCFFLSFFFPDVHYLIQPVPDYVQATISTVLDIHRFQGAGDILAFLTGQEEIESTVQLLDEKLRTMQSTMKTCVLPLYANLPMDQQQLVFQTLPKDTRKIIISTNVAETSITIDGIVYVVDCGFVKVPPILSPFDSSSPFFFFFSSDLCKQIRAYNSWLGIETLLVTPVSKAEAKQRAGRAGRSRPGKCYRLYSEEAYKALSAKAVPEIQR
jgi:ATP-dependent RNA helicase DDX35